jgi:hypothetical protein
MNSNHKHLFSPYLLPQITNLHLVAGTRTFKRGSTGCTTCSEADGE